MADNQRITLDVEDPWATTKQNAIELDVEDPWAVKKPKEDLSDKYVNEDRGFIGDLTSRAARGVVQAAKGIGGALRMSDFDPDKDEGLIGSTGKKITDWADEATKKYDILKPDVAEAKKEEGFVKRGLGGAIESTPSSLLPLVGVFGGAKVGALAGSPLGPAGAAVGAGIGATIGGVGTLFGTFGLGEYQNTYDETKKILKDKGVSNQEAEDKAHSHALTSAAAETGGEFVGDLAAATFFGVFGKTAVKQGVKQTIKQILSPGGVKEFAKATAKTVPFEAGSEVGTAYFQTESARDVGVTDMSTGEAMKEAVLPAVFMSLIFGSSIHGMQAIEAHNLAKSLNSTDPTERAKAAQAIYERIDKKDAESRKVWSETAQEYINSGKEFPLSKPIADFAYQKSSQEETSIPDAINQGLHQDLDDATLSEAIQNASELVQQNPEDPKLNATLRALENEAEARKTSTQVETQHESTGPADYSDLITTHAEQYGVEPSLLKAVAQADGGLMALDPQVANAIGIEDIADPDQNIQGGSMYLSALLQKYQGDENKALTAYKWGVKNVDLFGVENAPPEIKEYISSVQNLNPIGLIDSGLRTGQVNGAPFGENEAVSFIQEKLSDGTFSKDDLTKLKDQHPSLISPLNDLITESLKAEISQAVGITTEGGIQDGQTQKTETLLTPYTHQMGEPLATPFGQQQTPTYMMGKEISGPKFAERPAQDVKQTVPKRQEIAPAMLTKDDETPIIGSTASWTRGKETFKGTIQSIDEKNNLKIKAENGKVYSIRPDKVKDFKINPANTIDQGEIVDSRANGEAVISPVIPQTSENMTAEGEARSKETARGTIGMKLAAGEVALTSSGRKTTAFPKLSFDSKQGATNTVKRVDEWLHSNAIAEAEARGDDYNATIFKGANPKKLSQADKDSFEQYLFGEQPKVVPSILKPLVTEEAKQGESVPEKEQTEKELSDDASAYSEEARRNHVIELAQEFKKKGAIKVEDGDLSYLVHKSTKEPGKIQVTTVDKKGPLADFQADTLRDALTRLVKDHISPARYRRPDLPPDAFIGIYPKGTLFVYEYRSRLMSIGTQPKGYVKGEDGGKFGRVVYDRPLTKDELDRYELKPIEYRKAETREEKQSKQEPIVTAKKSKKKGPQNIITRILAEGGLNVQSDYSNKYLKQYPDLKRAIRNTGISPDDMAAILKDEGYLGFESGDELVELLKEGKGKETFTPENLGDKIESRIRSMEDEWIEEQLANLAAAEEIDPGAVEESRGDILDGLEGKIAEEGLSEADAEAALDELSDFFESVAPAKEETAAPQEQSVKESYTEKAKAGTLETAEIPGASFAETFALAPSPGALGEKPKPHETNKTANLFEEARVEAPEVKEQPVEKVDVQEKPEAAEESAKVEAVKIDTLVSYDTLFDRVYEGNITPEELKTAFSDLIAAKDSILRELTKLTKDTLLKRMGGMGAYRYKNDTKGVIVKAVYQDMLSSFTIGRGISFGFGKGEYEKALQKLVDNTTDEDIKSFAKQVAERREEYKKRIQEVKKALDNPETLDEFQEFIRLKGKDKLTPEQLRQYDELAATDARESKKTEAERKGRIQEAGATVGAQIVETKHTKKGHDLFVVQLAERVDREVYNKLNIAAKKMGGYYSSFRGNGAVPGFQFTTRETAEAFQKLASEGDTQTATEVAQERKEARTDEKETKAVSRMREIASRLAKKANESLNQDRLTNTSRRARMADSAEAAARRELQIAETMNNIADAIESGEAKHLVGLRTKVQVELLNSMVNEAKRNELSKKYESYSEQEQHKGEPATEETVDYISPNLLPRLYKGNIRYLAQHASKIKGVMRLAEKWEKKASGQDEYYQVKSLDEIDELSDMATKSGETTNTIYLYGVVPSNRLHSMGIETPEMERAALREFIKFRSGMKKADKAKELERSLIGKNVGIDFFPTPKETAKRMIEEAGIKEGMDVLEPSAGNGNIAEVIRESGVEPDVVEVSGSLREILEAKNFNLVGQDFTDYAGKLYDRIIMNPPFSKNQDIEHVKHAYELLKPGGRIVAIMGEGAFFRNDKTATGFREWLEEVGGTEEKLPEGTFADRTLMSTTGANARLVAIDKPSEIQTRETDTGVEMYSLKEEEYGEISTGGVTESDLKDLFPGQKIEKVGNLYVVTTKGGGFFLVENVERIDRNNGKVMLGYGRKMKQNEVISGSYLKGEIKISKSGDVWTLAHESIHYLEDAGLLDERDIAVLKAHVRRLVANKQFKTNNRNDIGGAEDRADFLMDAMSQRPKYTGLVGRVMDKVYRIVDAMGAMFGKRTVDAIIREVKSGEVYNKPVTRKLGMPLAEPSESDINRYMTSRKGTGENIPPKTTQQPEGGEPKWYSFGSEARKKYFDPDSIREKGNYDIWDHDEGKWWTFRDKAHEQSFREKYPLAFLTEEPAGAEKTWYRFGNPPQGNRSVNFADNKGEAGVSVYATPEGNNPFFADRDVYSGPGRQIGWGSDGEPLIIPTGEWKKFNPNPSRPPEVGGQDDVAVKERYKVEQATASPEKPRLKTVEELVKWLNDQSKATDDPFTETTRKQSSLSKKTYKQALESTLIAEDKAPDVLEYDVMPMQEQADLAADLINKDIAKAKRIALGQEEPEGKLRKGTVYRAVELWAHDQGDTELIAKLIRSPISLEMTKQGQEIAATRKKHLMETLGMKYYESPVNAVRDVEDILRENIEKRTGKKVSKEAEAEAEAWEKKFAELNKTITDQAAEIKKYTSQEYIDELIKKHGKEGKPRTVKPRAEYGAKNKVVTRESYEQAKQEWHKMFGSTQLHAGIDPSAIALLTRIGAYHFEAGARQFAAWAQKVVDDTHPSVKPYLKEVFEKAKAAFGQSLTQKIKKGIEKGRDLGELQRHVTDLTISFIEEGITDGNEVVEAVHDELRQIDPEITLEETRDAISGYGNWKPLTHDDVLDRYREIKQEQQLVAKLRDLQEKGTIEKTGRERQEMTPLARDLTKQVNELKKKYGLSMTDPETQLRSALEAYKRRLEQQIADLDREIKTKEKIVREKYDLPLDQEAKELKAERDQKKATRDSIFGKPELSDEQRLRLALQAAKRSAAEYARRIAEHDFSPLLKNRKALTSEALNKAKKDRDDARKAYQELREAEHPGEAALKALETRLNNELNRYKQMIANRDFTKQERKPRNLSPELKRLMEQRDTMRMGVRAAAEAAGRLTNEDIERIAKLASVVTELREAIGNGGDRLAYGAAVWVYHQYLQHLKGVDASLGKLIHDRWEQAKTTRKEEGTARAVSEGVGDTIKTASDISVTTAGSLDNSFLFRQGMYTLLKGEYRIWGSAAIRSFLDIYKTLSGRDAITALMADYYSRPNFLNGNYQKAGIKARHEEEVATDLPERMYVLGRLFKASNAAFNGSALRMRMDLFDKYHQEATDNGADVSDKMIEDFGKLAGSLTQRAFAGKSRDHKSITNVLRTTLDTILWAPKMLEAEYNILTVHSLGAGLSTGYARKKALANTLKIGASIYAITSISAAILSLTSDDDDDDVVWNIFDPRFLQIRIGGKYFDPTAKLGSLASFIARMAFQKKYNSETGVYTEYEGVIGKQSVFAAMVDFLANKTKPVTKVFIDYAKGRDFEGRKPTVSTSLYGAYVPIPLQNAVDNMKSDAEARWISVVADFVGIGTQEAGTWPVVWREDQSDKAKKLYDRVGEKRFKELNKEYNDQVKVAVRNLTQGPSWKTKSNADKEKELDKTKDQIRARYLGK